MKTNRTLDILGIPSLPARAFLKSGGQIRPQSGEGSGGGNSNITQTSIPEYARPFVETSLGKAQALTEEGFTPYTGQQLAGFTPMQTQAFSNIAGQQTSPQLTDASNLAFQVGQAGLGASQNAYGLQGEALGMGRQAVGMGQNAAQMGQAGMGYGAQGANIGQRGVSAAEQGFNAQNAYRQQATSADEMGKYMSPYMQNVVDVQQKEAVRQSGIQDQALKAQAVGAGAFGGSRQAIVQAEAQRGLQDRLAGIQATGSQSAFDKAQQAQQYGAGLGIQGLQAGYQGLQAGMAGTAQGMQGAETGMRGQQAGIQGVQAGLGGVGQATSAGQYGIQGLGAAGQAATTLGNVGQTQFQQQSGINQAMASAGAQQQGLQQQALDRQYQDFMNAQNFDYRQLGFMSDMLRGLPLTQQTQTMYQNPSITSQLAGLGTAGIGAYKLYNMKDGGKVKSGDGLDALGLYNAMRKRG